MRTYDILNAGPKNRFMANGKIVSNSAKGANVGNLPKPTPEVEANLDRAVQLVQKMDYEGIVREFGKPLDVVTSTIRPSFRAPEGFKFVIADLNAIENRGGGYISRCDSILKVFRDKKDPYLDFATYFYGLTYEQVEYEYKILKDKTKRTMSKPATLGAMFGLGPGEETIDKNGDKIWTGLLGYARNMGVVMTLEEADKAIKIFRNAYPEVKHTWKDLERACIRAIKNPGQMVGVGSPSSDKEREYMISQGRNPNLDPIISFKCSGKKVLEMILPSGTSLHYIDPEVTEEDAIWNGKPYKRQKISYQGKEQNSANWGRVSTFGGKLFENADQKLSRDVLCNGLKNADAMGFEIVGHTYDEAVTLVPINSPLGVDQLCECMTRPTSWGGDAFPLGASGFEDVVYRKD